MQLKFVFQHYNNVKTVLIKLLVKQYDKRHVTLSSLYNMSTCRYTDLTIITFSLPNRLNCE